MQVVDHLVPDFAGRCRVLQKERVDGGRLTGAVAVEADAMGLHLAQLRLVLGQAEI